MIGIVYIQKYHNWVYVSIANRLDVALGIILTI
jgi:hypothetical protein